jgi:Family of unknown function (DUF6188)
MNNACTIRFMRPGFSAYPGGYMLYTDEAGDYVNPRTGDTRSQTSSLDPTEDRQPMQTREAVAPARWNWPADAMREDVSGGEFEFLADHAIAGVQNDAAGVRLVLDRGDRPEPRLYVDLWRPEHRVIQGDRRDPAPLDLALVGTSISDAVVQADALELLLSDGTRLRCAAQEDFEAWQVVAEGVGLFACLPGGDMVTFLFGS